MKSFNWKMALNKCWLELVVAITWLGVGVAHLFRAIEFGTLAQWSCAICSLLCCSCWLYVFFKRAKREGC